MASRSGWFGVGVPGGEGSPGAKAWGWGGGQWDVEGEADEGRGHLEMFKQKCWSRLSDTVFRPAVWSDRLVLGRQAVEAGRPVGVPSWGLDEGTSCRPGVVLDRRAKNWRCFSAQVLGRDQMVPVIHVDGCPESRDPRGETPSRAGLFVFSCLSRVLGEC